MKALVVFESHWGNTALVAKAIAEGIGSQARAISTAEASSVALQGVDLLVVGAPLMGFSLPTESMIKSLDNTMDRNAPPPDLSHPSVRSWLASLPKGNGHSAAFETRIWWSPGSAAKTIESELEKAGYRRLAEPHRFIVQGKYGPMRAGELEKAKQWGIELAKAMG